MKRYCPNCDHELVERDCKLVCERCGCFADCGDGMLP